MISVRSMAFAMLGGCLGFIYAFILMLLYYFQEFDMPVTDSFRMRSALIITTILFIVVLAAANYRYIIEYTKAFIKALDTYEESDEDDAE